MQGLRSRFVQGRPDSLSVAGVVAIVLIASASLTGCGSGTMGGPHTTGLADLADSNASAAAPAQVSRLKTRVIVDDEVVMVPAPVAADPHLVRSSRTRPVAKPQYSAARI